MDHAWNRDRIRRALNGLPGLKLQEQAKLSRLKVSYYYDADKAPSVEEITDLLHQEELTANVLLSFGQFLDIIPSRASKGQALRYMALRLDIPLENILVAGGSGADEDMMRGNTSAVVVANRHHEELSGLSACTSRIRRAQPACSTRSTTTISSAAAVRPPIDAGAVAGKTLI